MKRAKAPAILLGPLCFLAACTYGPPRLEVKLENHRAGADTSITAFAVHATWLRDPTGISKWPDGGVAKVLAEAGAVYVCNARDKTTRRLWRADRPDEVKSSYTPWLGPWDSTGLYFSVRGITTKTSDGAPFRRNYRINRRGGLDSNVVEPALGAATSANQECEDAVRAAATADPPAKLPG
jgi:hypothetical protein